MSIADNNETTIHCLRDIILSIYEHRNDPVRVGHLAAEALDLIDGDARKISNDNGGVQ